jgi:hypothetical protein
MFSNQMQRKPDTSISVQKGAIEGASGYVTGAILTSMAFLAGSLITWIKGLPFEIGLVISLALAAVLAWVFERLSRVWYMRRALRSSATQDAGELTATEAMPAYVQLQEKYVEVSAQLAGKKQQLKEEGRKLLDMTEQKSAVYNAWTETKDELAELQWIKPIANEQAEHLSSLVLVEKVVIPGHRLLSDSDYIELYFKIKNYSVYKISIEEVLGNFSYNSEPFEASPVLIGDSLRELPFWQRGGFTLKQSLTRRETLNILNTPAAIAFHRAKIPLKTTPAITENHELHIGFTVDREVLIQAYRKLEVALLSTDLKEYRDLTENRRFGLPEHLGSVINIHLKFENPNQRTIDIKRYKLTTHENDGTPRTTVAQKGEIRESPARGVSGEAQGLALPNLSDRDICAEQREPYEGWLQFIVKTHPQNLRGGVAVLTILDEDGVEHPAKTGALQYRPEGES